MSQINLTKNRLFGRQKGPNLTARQQQLIDELLPKVSLQPLPEKGETLNLSEIFADSISEFHLEIGFGGAEHLVWQAQNSPDIGFLGCEPFINGVAKLLTAIHESDLPNIRVYDDDARNLLDVLPDAVLEKVYVLFPDPWHKRRHNKRRFINQKNLDQLARVMKPGAHLCFASDIPHYIEWTQNHIKRNTHFAPIEGVSSGRPQTRYEQKAIREGRTPVDLTFVRSK